MHAVNPVNPVNPMHRMRPMLDRRSLLTGSAAVTLSAIAGAREMAEAEPTSASPTKRDVDMSDAELLAALVRLRGSTDGTMTCGWLESQRYAVVDNEAHPLCRVLAASLQSYQKLSDTLYEATVLEIAHYVDLASGELLREVRIPGSDGVASVPTYRFGPSKVRFAVRLDENEPFYADKEGADAGKFAPAGNVHMMRSITRPQHDGVNLFVRHEEVGRVHPARANVKPVAYREWTIWRGPSAIAQDPRATYSPCEHSYTAMTSWRPWMRMGDTPGHTLDTGRGAKTQRLEELPRDFLELTHRVHPDVLDDPEKALRKAT